MPKARKIENHKSLFANAVVASVANELIQEIRKYLDEKQELKFDVTVNCSFVNEEMRLIVKRGGQYFLGTLDNSTGSELFEYEIEDSGNVSVYDLIWIMEQIECEQGV